MDIKITLIGAFDAAMQTMVELNHGAPNQFWRQQYLLAIGGAMAMWQLLKIVDPEHPLLGHAAKLLNDAQEDLVSAELLPNTVQMFE